MTNSLSASAARRGHTSSSPQRLKHPLFLLYQLSWWHWSEGWHYPLLGTTVSPVISVALGTPTSPGGAFSASNPAITDRDAVLRRGGCGWGVAGPLGCCSRVSSRGDPVTEPWERGQTAALAQGWGLPLSVKGQRAGAPFLFLGWL